MVAAFDALDAAFDAVLALDSDALSTWDRLEFLERSERLRRRLPTVEHPLINGLTRQATPEELGGKLSQPTSTSPSSTTASRWRCITASGWTHTSAKPITSPTTPEPAPPISRT
jgi:hypothetical protein